MGIACSMLPQKYGNLPLPILGVFFMVILRVLFSKITLSIIWKLP